MCPARLHSWLLLRGGRSPVSSTPAGFKMFHFPLKWQAASQKFMHVHLLLTLPRLRRLPPSVCRLPPAPCGTHLCSRPCLCAVIAAIIDFKLNNSRQLQLDFEDPGTATVGLGLRGGCRRGEVEVSGWPKGQWPGREVS